MNKTSEFQSMDKDFLTWSIPNYFIHNYRTKQFHKNCEGICQGALLVKHLIEYFTEWKNIIRGNWISAFQISTINSKKQGNSQQFNLFEQFVHSFHLDQDLLFVIEFVTKCYQLLNIDCSLSQKNQQLSALNSVYFKYRLSLGLKCDIDVGQPPLIIHLLKCNLKFISKISSQSTISHDQTIKLIKQIAISCDFYQLYLKINQQSSSCVPQSLQKISIKDNQCLQICKNVEFSPPAKMIFKNEDDIYQTPKFIEDFSKQKLVQYPKIKTTNDNRVRRIIEKKNKQKLQDIHKMATAPRFSNFKGKFKKKDSQKQTSPKYNKIERFIDINLSEHKGQKLNTKGEPKESDIEGYDFLCDRSF